MRREFVTTRSPSALAGRFFGPSGFRFGAHLVPTHAGQIYTLRPQTGVGRPLPLILDTWRLGSRGSRGMGTRWEASTRRGTPRSSSGTRSCSSIPQARRSPPSPGTSASALSPCAAGTAGPRRTGVRVSPESGELTSIEREELKPYDARQATDQAERRARARAQPSVRPICHTLHRPTYGALS